MSIYGPTRKFREKHPRQPCLYCRHLFQPRHPKQRFCRPGCRRDWLSLERPRVGLLRENNVRKGFFQPEQFSAVLNHLPGHVKPVVRFAYITGWRANSEILPLQWRQVDFAAGIVSLDPGTTKNKEGRVFPMTGELRELLEELKVKREALQRETGTISPWVFTYEGRHFKSIKRSWNTACRTAGLPGRLVHDFRRTAVRNLVRAGIPERVGMQMTGHKTRAVFERYNIVSQSDLFDAARKLDAITVTERLQSAPEQVQPAFSSHL